MAGVSEPTFNGFDTAAEQSTATASDATLMDRPDVDQPVASAKDLPIEVSPAAIVYDVVDELLLDTVLNILKNPTEDYMSMLPPIKPTAGSVYVFKPGTPLATRRSDQYRWIVDGATRLPRKCPLVKKHYFYAVGNGGKKSKEFRKYEYELLASPELGDASSPVLVHYMGNEAECCLDAPHGNAKVNPAPYIRSSAQVKHRILEEGTASAPAKLYKKLVADVKCPGPSESVLKPRNWEQVRNFQKAERRRLRIGRDGLFNCIELAVQFPEYIHYVQVIPNLIIYLANEALIAEMGHVLDLGSTCDSIPAVQIFYDTTFTLGDFYVSCVCFKHILFNQAPVIPVALVIHERKFKDDHIRFMEFLRGKCSALRNRHFCIVTDGEFAFADVFPNSSGLLCWNHIRRDVRNWLRNKRPSGDDIRVYCDQVAHLLTSPSESEFNLQYDTFSGRWSQLFKEYFDSSIKSKIVLHAGRWILEAAGCYNAYSGITTNPSESLNRVLHELSDWKERPVDAMIVSLKYLQSFYEHEINRGIHGLGNYVIRDRFRAMRQPADLMPTSDNLKTPDEIVAFVKNSIVVAALDPRVISDGSQKECDFLEPGQERYAQRALAQNVVDSGNIAFVPHLRSFMVKGSRDEKYAVTLFPKERCQCPSKSACYHILAAKLWLGIPVGSEKPRLSLTQLRKRSLSKRDKTSGRKKPRLGDYDVDPAPDSRAAAVENAKTQNIDGQHCLPDPSDKVLTSFHEFLETADGRVAKRMKSREVVCYKSISQVPCLLNREACVIQHDENYHVLVNQTLNPSTPNLMVYSFPNAPVADESLLYFVTAFVPPGEFCKEMVVSVRNCNVADMRSLLGKALQKPSKSSTTKEQRFRLPVYCVCRKIFASDLENIEDGLLECKAPNKALLCYRKYHRACLSSLGVLLANSEENWMCPMCTLPKDLVRWGATKSMNARNTCAFDNFLAALHLESMENATFITYLGDSPAEKCLQHVIHLLGNSMVHDAKDLWMQFLSLEDGLSSSCDGVFNFRGTEHDRFLKFFTAVWTVLQKSSCQSEHCPRRYQKSNRWDFAANSGDDIATFASFFASQRSITCAATFQSEPPENAAFFLDSTGESSTEAKRETACCADIRVIEPLGFVDPEHVWGIPFNLGAGVTLSEVLSYPLTFTVNERLFKLRLVTLHSVGADHFTSLMRWNDCWMFYDGVSQKIVTWFLGNDEACSEAFAGYRPNHVFYLAQI